MIKNQYGYRKSWNQVYLKYAIVCDTRLVKAVTFSGREENIIPKENPNTYEPVHKPNLLLLFSTIPKSRCRII